jgi:uncharacterized RDD family membrane protein YckC
MKCPKCGYLGFETGDRCRNCGYDFSLAALFTSDGDGMAAVGPGAAAAADGLLLRSGPNEAGPLGDFRLGADFDESLEQGSAARAALAPDLDRLIGVQDPATPPPVPSAPLGPVMPRKAPAVGEPPLFGDAAPELVPRARATPRAPLAVRRSTPEVPRMRPRHTPRRAAGGSFDDAAPPLSGLGLPTDPPASADLAAGAPPARRLGAALIDLAVLGAIDAAVLYLTLRLSGLGLSGVTVLPWMPLLSFLLLLNGGYFITFAAVGGQTIGQMTCGLKVVGRDGGPLGFGTATLRTLTWVVSALPLGLGLWFALGPEQQALHDRLTATRVVLS